MTPLDPVDTENGFFVFDYNKDLYYLKILNTSSGRIEIYRLPASSNYSRIDFQTLAPYNAESSRFTINNGDLCRVFPDSSSGMIWPAVSTQSSRYFASLITGKTPFSWSDAGKVFTFHNKDLYFIQIHDEYTNDDKVKVHLCQKDPSGGPVVGKITPTMWSRLLASRTTFMRIRVNGPLALTVIFITSIPWGLRAVSWKCMLPPLGIIIKMSRSTLQSSEAKRRDNTLWDLELTENR